MGAVVKPHKGARVRLTEEARGRWRGCDPLREGTIVRVALYTYVLWDGRKSEEPLHPDFLEPV